MERKVGPIDSLKGLGPRLRSAMLGATAFISGKDQIGVTDAEAGELSAALVDVVTQLESFTDTAGLKISDDDLEAYVQAGGERVLGKIAKLEDAVSSCALRLFEEGRASRGGSS